MQKLCLLSCIVLLLSGCRKDEVIDKVSIDEKPPVVLVVSSFKGKVVDESGEPLASASVTVFNKSTLTDSKGLFEFKNIEAPKDAALVKVEKAGFFTGSAMSGNSADGQQYVRVTLIPKGAAQSVDAATGGTLSWPGGLTVRIQPNTLRYTNGNLYTGLASVQARWLDPTGPELGNLMPGALMARDEKGQERVLAEMNIGESHSRTLLTRARAALQDLITKKEALNNEYRSV